MKNNFCSYRLRKTIALSIGVLSFSFLANAGAQDDDRYVYKTIPAAGYWNSCEATREGALAWALRAQQNSAHEDCRDLGDGWNFHKISLEGYQGITPCRDGRSFKGYYERGQAVCKHLRPRDR
jgi:hypothetical protein